MRPSAGCAGLLLVFFFCCSCGSSGTAALHHDPGPLPLLPLPSVSPGTETPKPAQPPDLLWVLFLGGTYTMGSAKGYPDTRPLHAVTLDPFEIMRTEVTVEMFRACVEAGRCGEYRLDSSADCNWGRPGREDHPINCISWFDARDFCAWAGARLPSEAEWEHAARSGGKDQTYPWGEDVPTCDHAVMHDLGEPGALSGCGTGITQPVCSRDAGSSEQGLCDLAGNVYEWMEDCWHDDYEGAAKEGKAWVKGCDGPYRVERGGGFGTSADIALAATSRYRSGPADRNANDGFRCARDAAMARGDSTR